MRVHPRFALDAVVELATKAGALLGGRTCNVSRGGLCVELAGAIDPGDEVEIRIALRFHDDGQSEPLLLPARVVWCTPLGDGYQIGSQFRTLSLHQSADLDLFLGFIDASPRPPGERIRKGGGKGDPFAS